LTSSQRLACVVFFFSFFLYRFASSPFSPPNPFSVSLAAELQSEDPRVAPLKLCNARFCQRMKALQRVLCKCKCCKKEFPQSQRISNRSVAASNLQLVLQALKATGEQSVARIFSNSTHFK